MPHEKLVLASANPKKVAELRQLLAGHFLVEPRPEYLTETVEDGETLEANALKKAHEVSSALNAAALADDTGLFVNGLEGKPGVRSARYAGDSATDETNVAKLLSEMALISDRSASFKTVIALVRPNGTEITAQGAVHGSITLERRGDAGFGYDCVFQPTEGDGRTFAEMSSDDKNKISHRSRAFKALVDGIDQ